jgi:GntR family transcriptional regulator, transcriptional repressor for pyruvate dehydrogenase complex
MSDKPTLNGKAVARPHKLFDPIKTERTFERVSTKIKGLIFDGILAPGDRLPSETELAQQFDVGRQSIREALRILELSGFITIQKGGNGGPMIRTTILDTINSLFLDAFRLERITTEELTLARIEIEKVVLGYAIDLADEQDIRGLRDNIQKARKKIEDNIMAIDENVDFHNLLARASRNHVFVMVVGSIMAVVRDHTSRLTASLEGTNSVVQQSESVLISRNAVDIHEEIVNAMLEKDRAKAVVLMDTHVRDVGLRLESLTD